MPTTTPAPKSSSRDASRDRPVAVTLAHCRQEHFPSSDSSCSRTSSSARRIAQRYYRELRRRVRMARLLDPSARGQAPMAPTMPDVRLIGTSPPALSLSGFERSDRVELAQSWPRCGAERKRPARGPRLGRTYVGDRPIPVGRDLAIEQPVPRSHRPFPAFDAGIRDRVGSRRKLGEANVRVGQCRDGPRLREGSPASIVELVREVLLRSTQLMATQTDHPRKVKGAGRRRVGPRYQGQAIAADAHLRIGTREMLIEDVSHSAGHSLRVIDGVEGLVVDQRIRVRTDGRTLGNPGTSTGVLRLRLVPSPS